MPCPERGCKAAPWGLGDLSEGLDKATLVAYTNALIYMHRFTPSTVSTVLNEYLREFQAKLKASLEHAERSNNAMEADQLRKILLELNEYEHDVLYPLASQNITIDLDDGVKKNYLKFGDALKKIPGLEASE